MERYRPFKARTKQEVLEMAAGLFPERTLLYAVLDDAVCFGIYDAGQFLVGLPDLGRPVPMAWDYLQELRIFNERQELLLILSENGWTGRIRRDDGDAEASGEYVITERQKLWGKKTSDPRSENSGWTLLTSERGTRIWIPVDMGPWIDEAAILVQRYMRIADVTKGEELVYQKDIRMAGICPWKGVDKDVK